ncbi:osteoclast stimulatory transmembrane protein [Hemicordylus capensis]|uniref:osteoclast stimulatory transmembrane protein n=1 Tax=Hemicordylus capensis TaxID=884348 RepID=UPI002304A4DE|nr:osteoclast stimulatory transmembrane protein [Hemicordylus capensis]
MRNDLNRRRLRIWNHCQDILFPRIQQFTLEAWLAYSTPLPSNHKQLLSLFLICCCIAVSIGGLFYHWMFSSLEYSFQFSATTAAVISLLALLTLFLVHPIRCMFTMIVPTLGTKQGRKLLLSTCFMIVAVNIVPNIMNNIQSILKVIECIWKNSSKSLLTSTVLLGSASRDFSEYLINMKQAKAIWKPMDSPAEFKTFNNHNLLNQKMINASQGIKEDFSHVQLLAQKSMLLANRVIAGFLLFYLIFESAWYLKCYLTDFQFDNIYITKKLKALAHKNKATHLLVCSPKKLIKSTGLRLSQEELMTSLMNLFFLTLVLMLMIVVIVVDYVVFHLAEAAVMEIAQFPVVPITFQIKYHVKIILRFLGFFPHKSFYETHWSPFEMSYHLNMSLVSDDCSMKCPNPPNTAVTLAVGLLCCIIYAMVFLETYSHRLCRKISASFFESQEDQRVQYLYRKLVRKYKKREQKEQEPTVKLLP